MYTLHTSRLTLRPWRESDMAAFAALNADPAVMEHFPAPLGREESDALARRIMEHMARHGWGLWAMEVDGEHAFAGFTGLHHCSAALPFAPALEVGWRLARPFWGRGFATEAAVTCLDFAFTVLRQTEVLSFTAKSNSRSRAVMQRLGMQYCGDFEHPALPPGHALRPHVLFALTASQHAALAATSAPV